MCDAGAAAHTAHTGGCYCDYAVMTESVTTEVTHHSVMRVCLRVTVVIDVSVGVREGAGEALSVWVRHQPRFLKITLAAIHLGMIVPA